LVVLYRSGDRGVYTCQAVNEAGIAVVQLQVNVLGTFIMVLTKSYTCVLVSVRVLLVLWKG